MFNVYDYTIPYNLSICQQKINLSSVAAWKNRFRSSSV